MRFDEIQARSNEHRRAGTKQRIPLPLGRFHALIKPRRAPGTQSVVQTFVSRIADNLNEIRCRIAAAAARSGRPAEAVRLVAVTKSVGMAAVRELVAAG